MQMHPLLKNVVRIGTVSSIQPEECTARVAFEDQENVVSSKLPILTRGSLGTQDYWMPSIGEQVICWFLPSGNAEGFISGSFYSEADKPPVTDPNKRHIRFSDGTFIEYDQKTHTLTIDVTQSGGEVIINGKFTHNGPVG